MHFTTSTAVILGFAVLGSSHMIMTTPIPYGKSSLTNSPLDGMGADFPCKQRSGVYDAQGASNSMALGSTQPLKFVGGATHGGGSCQISVTYDSAPSKSSKFKVIHSIIGGCPIEGVAGNNGESADSPDPSTYSFKIPSNLPTGNATLAWTWFNKIGNREMYMNCAPVTLTGASTKRDEEGLEGRNATQLVQRDQAAFDALPDMFVANLEGAGVGCRTGVSMDTIFPNPGDSVESLGGATKTDAGPPIGCSTAAGGAASGGSSSGATTSASGAPTSAPVAGSSPVASAPVAASSLPGGVFAGQPGGSSAASAAPTAAPAASSAPAASEASPAASQPAATQASSASTPASTGTTGSGSAMAAGAACSPEGTWNCIGGTQFQQCASGVWSAAQPVAGGTTCTAGQSASIDVKAVGAKRSLRKVPRRALVPQGFHA
ncbi:hypothetical protein LHYA1_G007528 [Lachnellula hyalina]|uniref:Chitin-binding type-4 domain-containing protein n=1 Tax=Lachnellula hyalina TaxID=1316788 RepID=A0A8H8QVR2_9HELO|nr:uncharacterized protein LHYA1_G007528 [Lachnellula hyalina]TVY23583.1 hypothetical protein LHYA1_G007528 [Lachnellula hyalina]